MSASTDAEKVGRNERNTPQHPATQTRGKRTWKRQRSPTLAERIL